MADTEADTATDTAGADEAAEAEAVETDEAREAVLGTLRDALGDRLLDSHVAPGRGVWIRVDREAWTAAAEAAKTRSPRGRLSTLLVSSECAISRRWRSRSTSLAVRSSKRP